MEDDEEEDEEEPEQGFNQLVEKGQNFFNSTVWYNINMFLLLYTQITCMITGLKMLM